jgi:hypothetical protein
VPKDEDLLLEVLGPCGDVVYSENIGPLAVDTELPTIDVDLGDEWSTISGNLLDCEGDPVGNGYALTTLGQQSYVMLSNALGEFQGYFPTCGASEGEVFGVDLDNSLISSIESFPVEEVVNLGNIEVCDQQLLTEIVVNYNGTTLVIPDVTVTIDDNGNGTIYTFNGIKNYPPSDQVIYQVTVLNWTGDPNNPLWGLSINNTVVGNPPEVISFVASDSDIEAIYLGSDPGDFVQFELTNCSVNESVSGMNYTGTASITGLIVN